MAFCPECFSEKPFWANRCHACNEYIGFVYQSFGMWIYYGTVFFGVWFFWGGAINWFDQTKNYIFNWNVLVYFLVWVLIPFLVVWVSVKLRQVFGWWLLPIFLGLFLILLLTV